MSLIENKNSTLTETLWILRQYCERSLVLLICHDEKK